MDDDRLARAREGDLDAFLALVRARAGRLHRLAAIGAGDPAIAHRTAATAIRTAWRDVRRIGDADGLEPALERALVAALPRRPSGGNGPGGDGADPLARALRALPPGHRVALARCLDPHPDHAALAVAGRAGVDVGVPGDGAVGGVAPGGGQPGDGGRPSADLASEIIDLDGPLAGWDLGRLRAALGAEARGASPDAEALFAELRAELAGSRPDAGLRAVMRSALPGPATLARGAALALAAVVGIGVLATLPAGREAQDTGGAAAGPTAAPPGGGGTAGTPSRDADAAADTAAGGPPGGFPTEVDGLRVIGAGEARRLADSPALAGRSLAIRGWLSRPTFREPCLAPEPATLGRPGRGAVAVEPVVVDNPVSAAAAFCVRDAVLRESPGGEWSVAHLHPQLLPGTGLGRARRLLVNPEGRSIPVVVLAHFGDPRVAACAAGGRHCGEELVIDQVAWVYGAPARPPVAVRSLAPGTDTYRSGWDAMDLAESAYGGIVAVSASGVPEADLGLVEPEATDVPSPSGFAWLVRAIVEPRPSDPLGATRTWLVVDDRTGEVAPAPGAVAATADPGGTGFLFPGRVDGASVRTVAEARALAEAGLPEGSAIAVAGWLATPTLAGACLTGDVDRPLEGDAAFCRRGTILRGPTPDGRALYVQLPPGAPELPIGDAVDTRRMPVPVVALVESGSARSEPCWPTDNGCGRELVLERLLWVDGATTDVAVAELDGADLDPPRLSLAEVRSLAEEAVADVGRVVSIVRVPAARRGEVAPGAEERALGGDHAWIVRVRSPLVVPGVGRRARLERLWWLLVDDATGRAFPGTRPIADLPDEPPPATPPG